MDSFFVPKPKVFAAVKNSLSFVYRNINNFNDLLKLYLPYLVGAVGITVAGALMVKNGEGIGIFIMNYIYLCMGISWFQLLVLGPEKASFTPPFPPSRPVWRMLGFVALLVVGVVVFVLGMYLLSKFVSSTALGVAAVVLVPIGMWAMVRLSLYQVIAAIDSPLNIKQAFALSRGYAGRIFFSNILMMWTLMALYLVYYMIAGKILKYFDNGSDEALDSTPEILAYHLTELPNYLYITPVMAILMATLCANYFLIATKGGGK